MAKKLADRGNLKRLVKDLDQVFPYLKAIKPFSKVSGLNLNLHKTEGLCIGSISGFILNDNNIKWPTCPI
jgi:hypothetical protein